MHFPTLFFALLSLFWMVALPANSNQNATLYASFVTGDMQAWELEMHRLEKENQQSNEFETTRQLAFAYYGYIGFLFQEKRMGEARDLLDLMEGTLEGLLEKQPENAEILALYGTYFGLRIEVQKWKAPSYGMKSMNYINKAYALDSTHAYVLNEKANLTYHMPAVFGGGVENAVPLLEKSVALAEANPAYIQNNWVYLLAKGTLGKWYVEVGETAKARKLFNELLALEPDFMWVKNELMPLVQ